MAAKFLVFLAFMGLANAGPLSSRWTSEITSSGSRDCALQCSGRQNKFNYVEGTTYLYEYEVNTETSMAGASEDSAILNFQTLAEIEVMNSCELTLKLKNVQVSLSDPYLKQLRAERQSDYQQLLQRNILRFSFDDGLILNVCPENDEEIWALNFKRGVLSAFQNSMVNFEKNQRVHEIDVTGDCEEVEYNVTADWTWRKKTITVSKSKNLQACSKRDGFKSFFQMVPYTVPSDIQSLPVLKSSLNCEQKISMEKIVEMSSCEESHVYAPFSNGQSGGRTFVTQKLTYKSQRKSIDSIQGEVRSRQSLLFQHVNGNDQDVKGQESAERVLKEICEQTNFEIRPDTPRLFSELVQAVKTLNADDLREVFQKLKKNTICPQNDKAMKFFLDTLPVAGTHGSVQMMLIIFKQNRLNEVEKQAWLTSLSLINEPSEEILSLIPKLLKEPLTLQSLLPVSALVNNYCKKNINCMDNFYISQLVDLLDENIDYYCSVHKKNQHQVMLTLRAIGNIGNTRRLIPTIDRCITSNNVPIEVRISAIDAYRRIPCPGLPDESDPTLTTMWQDISVDPELRIATYKSLMRCPTHENLKLIVDQLNREEDEDVSGYVYSHLDNLRKTSDPHKQDIVQALKRHTISKKIEGKSSKNYESSLLLNKFNLGYAAEADVMWSKSSLIPRALRANLTMNLFGNSINLFDVGARMEGIEYLIRNYLENKDYLKEKDKQWSPEDLRLCLYGRIFGNEFAFKHIDGEKDLPFKDTIAELPNAFVKFAKKFNYDFTHSYQIFHGSLVVPTIAGMALNITVNSSASVHLGLNGQLGLNSIFTKRRAFNLDFDSSTSAGLEVTGSMIIDGCYRKMGLRMRNTLHSSVPIKGRTSLSPEQGFTFELDTPEEKIELFGAKSQFFIIFDTLEKEQNMIIENRKEYKKCTGTSLAKITGYEMCGELQFSNAIMKSDAPYFPLTGPTKVSLVLLKRDTHSGYKLFTKWDKTKKRAIGQFQMNTPGSQINRHISADVTVGYQSDRNIILTLITPWTNMNLNGKLILNDNVKSIAGILKMDEKEYGLTSEVIIQKKKRKLTYSPRLDIIYNGETKTLLTGEISVPSTEDISMTLDVNGLNKPFGNLQGAMTNTNKEKRLSLEVTPSGQSPFKFSAGSIIKEDKKGMKFIPEIHLESPKRVLLSLKSSGEYKFNKFVSGSATVNLHPFKPFTLSTELKKLYDTKKARTSYSSKFKVKSSKVNVDLTSSMMFEKKLINPQVKLQYNIEDFGKDFIKWHGKYSDKSKKFFKFYKLSSNLSSKENPDYNMITALDFHQKKETRFNFKHNYGKNSRNKAKQITIAVQLPNSLPDWERAKMSGMLTAKVPEKKWDMEVKLDHEHGDDKLSSNVNFHFHPFADPGIVNVQYKRTPSIAQISGSYSQKNKEIFSIDATKKIRSLKATGWSITAKSSARNVEGKANLWMDHEKLNGDASVNWDAGKKNKKSEVTLVGLYKATSVKDGLLGKGSLEFRSPFKNYEKLTLKMNVDKQERKLKSNGKFSWGGKQDQINIDLVTSLPLTVSEVNLLVALKSPFKGYRQMEMNIDHSLHKNWQTLLRGKMNKAESELAIKGNNKISEEKRIFNGEISLKTPYRSFKDVKLTLNHNDNYKSFTTTAGLVHNNMHYKANLDLTHVSKGNALVNRGTLVLTSPEDSIETTWSHHIENGMKKVASKLKSKSQKEELFNVKLSSSRKHTNLLEFEVDMDTKWKAFKKLDLQFYHNQKDKLLDNKAILKINKDKTGYNLKFLKEEDSYDTDLAIYLKPLLQQDITLKSHIKHSEYPMTLSAQLQWAPRMRITYDGSLNAPSLFNFDISSKVTTPFENYKNINIKSSITEDKSELIANFNIDYAIRKMIDIETRYRNDQSMKLISAKLTSPCPYIQSLNTGIQLDLNNKIDLKCDFDLQSLDRYGTHVSFHKDDSDMNGNIRIISPINVYTPFEAAGSIKTKRNSKKNIHLSFKSVDSEYSFDSSYKLKLPIQLTLNLRTPFPDFDNIGLSFRHDMPKRKVITYGSLTYFSKMTVEASMNLLYDPKIDGNLVIKTPFSTFEENKLIFQFDGKTDDFKSKASILVAEKKASYDVKFKTTTVKTTADFDVRTHLDGIEQIKGDFMMKGNIKNLQVKGGIQMGDLEMTTKISNIVRKDSMETSFILTHPEIKKLIISIKHEDKIVNGRRIIKNHQLWKLADNHIDISTDIDHQDFENTKASIKVDSDIPGIRNTSFNLERKADFIDFSAIMNTNTSLIDVMTLIIKSEGKIDNINLLFNWTWDDHSLLSVSLQTKTSHDKITTGQLTLGGHLIPEMTSKLTGEGDRRHFVVKVMSPDGNLLSHSFDYKYGTEIEEFSTYTKWRIWEKNFINKITFKRDLSEDSNFVLKISTASELKLDEPFSLEINHRGGYENFLTLITVQVSDLKPIVYRVEFSRDEWQRVEFSVGLSSHNKYIHDVLMEIKYELQENSFTGSLTLEKENESKVVASLLVDNGAKKILNAILEEPPKKKIYYLLNAEVADGEFTGKVKVEDDVDVTVTAVYSDAVYPYHPHLRVVTSNPMLRDLTFNVKGQPLDGKADIVLLLNDVDRLEASGVFKYEGILNFISRLSVDSTFENYQDLLLEVKASEDSTSKKTALTLNLGTEKKISFSGDYLSKDIYFESGIDQQLLVEVTLPIEKLQALSLDVGIQGDYDLAKGHLGFTLNSDKLLDMDLNYDIAEKKSISVMVLKPKPMEYSISQNEDGDLTQNEIFINWNRNEPESNIRLKSAFKDASDSSKVDRSASLVLIHPARSLGFEHSHAQTDRNILSAGKLFWNEGDDHRISYNLNINDKSQRRKTFIDGDFTLGLPMRTIGLSGNIRNNGGKQLSDLSFSWDLDNDKSKKINLNTKVSGNEELNADISLKFPAKVQVDSKLILNKGNTIFDGTTDISYSWDERKTLTFFSKLENNPESVAYFSSPGGYNYSIQFGIRHPDTKIDMKFNSHFGQTEERLTSSLGMDYLTSSRQNKNMALWLEIDKLKKEINLIGTNPYKNVGITGSIISQEPLKLQAVTTCDDEENFNAILKLDQSQKTLDIDIGSPQNELRVTAFYPNISALQINVEHGNPDGYHKEAGLVMNLATPHLLLLDLNWRPEVIDEIQNILNKTIYQQGDALRTVLSEISLDLEREISRKYNDLTTAMIYDSRPLISFMKRELNLIARQMSMLKRKLKRSESKNDLYLGDLMKILNRIQDKVIIAQDFGVRTIRNILVPLNSLPDKLEQLRRYPIQKAYRQLVVESNEKIDGLILSLSQEVTHLSQKIKDLQEISKALINNSYQRLAKHPVTLALIDPLKDYDISPYLKCINKCINVVTPYVLEVTDTITDVLISDETLESLQEATNEIYEEAKWALDYLDVENSLPRLAQSSMGLAKEVIQEEIKENMAAYIQFSQCPVTVYDPERGILRAAIKLPIDIDRLDEMPEFSEYLDESSNTIQQGISDLIQYLPSFDSDDTNETAPIIKERVRNPQVFRPVSSNGFKFKNE